MIQQGLNDARGEARRYHWLSENLPGFLDSPHSAIEGRNQGKIVNLADARAERNRRAGLELVNAGPDFPIRVLKRLRDSGNAAPDLFADHEPLPVDSPPLPHLHMPAHHEVRASDVVLRRLHGALAAAADRGPKDFTELLLTPGIGARTIASLALVSEVVHGAPFAICRSCTFFLWHMAARTDIRFRCPSRSTTRPFVC